MVLNVVMQHLYMIITYIYIYIYTHQNRNGTKIGGA